MWAVHDASRVERDNRKNEYVRSHVSSPIPFTPSTKERGDHEKTRKRWIVILLNFHFSSNFTIAFIFFSHHYKISFFFTISGLGEKQEQEIETNFHVWKHKLRTNTNTTDDFWRLRTLETMFAGRMAYKKDTHGSYRFHIRASEAKHEVVIQVRSVVE